MENTICDSLTDIRLATPEDFPAIQRIAKASLYMDYGPDALSPEEIEYEFDKLYSIESLEGQVKQGHSFIFCTLPQAGPVAFASFLITAGDTEPARFTIQKLYCMPD